MSNSSQLDLIVIIKVEKCGCKQNGRQLERRGMRSWGQGVGFT